jgi:uncharacterized protein YdhG (YjbR/CyaY superfamily)
MGTSRTLSTTVDEYIPGFPHEVQAVLKKIRGTVQTAAPEAEESISYRIPTLKLNGCPLIYFAAFKSHIGLYPMTGAVKDKFERHLSRFELSKGTLKFRYEQPVPYGLISRIVKFRTKEIGDGQNPQEARRPSVRSMR